MPNNQDKSPFHLAFVVVQAQDCDITVDALDQIQVNVTRLPSIGAFLGRRNATLLVCYKNEDRDLMMETIQKNCRQRTEYIAVPLESAPLPLPAPTPVTIGGATIFALDVDHYEEI